ncbi:protein-tyrosine phosphatase-like protein [Chaetomium sp. MPI-CAGE-AT-0009]|nr:protein-tyrosine phosphatase-like protein [Chaetomium sp. MPI-CAGE-AT-0009]
MAHLPRFHRRKKDVAAPTLITNNLPGKATPPPSDLPLGSPKRPFQKLSPFRVFQRSSGKRARDSPPASLPHSPAAAPLPAGDCADGRPVSPMSLKTDPASDEGEKPAKPPKMPAFLDQSQEEIENKFSELVWRERNRLMQSITNPSPDFRWARVAGSHLKVLDRYLNIQPWQNNRIKLQVPEGHVDYINASPIVLNPSPCPTSDDSGGAAREPDRYIAMQGPKHTSTDHVWRMVVEQLESPGVIVMLTETHEGHLEKCYPYFPRSPDDPPIEVNEHDEFGDGFRATVRCEGIEETPAGDAIELRKLVIRKWPDFGVPTLADLESFFTLMRLSRERNHSPASPRVVHCSAGVGRSGTFVALEHLMRELDAGVLEHYDERAAEAGAVVLAPSFEDGGADDDDSVGAANGSRSGSRAGSRGGGSGSNSPVLRLQGEGEDLIFETVDRLREQRRTMVQAEAQYVFIYRVLRQLWLEKYGSEAAGGDGAGEGEGGGDGAEEGGREDGEPAAKRLEFDPFVD